MHIPLQHLIRFWLFHTTMLLLCLQVKGPQEALLLDKLKLRVEAEGDLAEPKVANNLACL